MDKLTLLYVLFAVNVVVWCIDEIVFTLIYIVEKLLNWWRGRRRKRKGNVFLYEVLNV